MFRHAGEREELTVVGDQRGNPPSALDLAKAVLAIPTNLLASSAPDLRGIFCAAAGGEASWADLSEAGLQPAPRRAAPRRGWGQS